MYSRFCFFVLLSCHRAEKIDYPANDCNIHWAAISHDTFNPQHRSPIGSAPLHQDLTLSIRTQKNDLSSARLRLWNDRTNEETYLEMRKNKVHPAPEPTKVGGSLHIAPDFSPGLPELSGSPNWDIWSVTINTGADPTILYYFFELNDASASCADQDFYVDDDTNRYGGGPGVVIDEYNDWRSFQIVVYDPTEAPPLWTKGASIYQIFPDRFRDGLSSNNPKPRRAFYDDPNGAIFRSNTNDWSTPICDPRGSPNKQSAASPRSDACPSTLQNCLPNQCPGAYGQNFYGGDLRGVSDAIKDGYLADIDIIYLNPIFRAPSNHRYDPYNWSEIEPELGTHEDFVSLLAVAKENNVKIILDGVFNHVSAESPWFDRYRRHAEVGACESDASPYQSYFQFTPSAGDKCRDGGYQTFGGYSSLPKLSTSNQELRELIFKSVSHWNKLGVAGWRLDAALDVDGGPPNDPQNSFWEELRQLNKRQWLIGEAWGDAAPGLLGGEWHSATNYRLRGALLSWLFTSCQGEGCAGESFSDSDSNAQSFSGEIKRISLSQFNAQLLSIWEDTPPAAFYSMMNLLGSHDTNRVQWLLQKISGEDADLSLKKIKLAWLFLCTYPGSPTIYYGDEAMLDTPGVWDGGAWQDDPYNRVTLPTDARFDDFLLRLLRLRREHKVLREGEVTHGVFIDETKQLYAFSRTLGDETATIVLNRSQASQQAVLPGFSVEGVRELLSGDVLPVTRGTLPITVAPMQGLILLQTQI